MKRIAAATLALATLSACATAPSQSGYVGVSDPITTARAASFFQTVCINNGRDLSAARQTLAGLPVIMNSDDGIFYSTENLVSFKITPVTTAESVCSMVWDPIEVNADSMAAIQQLDPAAVLRDNNDDTITAFHYGAP